MGKNIRRILRYNRRFAFTLLALVVGFILILSGLDLLAAWIMGTGAVISLLPMMWDANQDFKVRKYSHDIIAIIAVVLAVVLQAYIVALLVLLLSSVRKIIYELLTKLSRRSLELVSTGEPKVAHLIRGRKEFDVAVSELKASSRILVKKGEIVPVDCTNTDGDLVVSGTLAKETDMELRVIADANNSQLHKIIKITRNAAKTESPLIRTIEKFTPFFIALSVALSGAVWLLSGEPRRALAVLVVAAPSYLVLSPTLALLSGMNRAVDKDIFFKSGTALERLADVKTLISSVSLGKLPTKVASRKISPNIKLGQLVKQIEGESERPNAFVSLGEENSAALTAADVGIVLGQAPVNIDSANVILLTDSKVRVSDAIKVARSTNKAIITSLVVGILISTLLQMAFAAYELNPVNGALCQLVLDILVMFIAFRAGKFSK